LELNLFVYLGTKANVGGLDDCHLPGRFMINAIGSIHYNAPMTRTLDWILAPRSNCEHVLVFAVIMLERLELGYDDDAEDADYDAR
jgi:hypothetical protein